MQGRRSWSGQAQGRGQEWGKGLSLRLEKRGKNVYAGQQGGVRASEGVHIWGRRTAGEARGAFSRGPDVPEPMSLAMMRHGGSSVAGTTQERCGPRVRAVRSRKADTSIYMWMMPPGPQVRFADWVEEVSQVSALDKSEVAQLCPTP